MRPRHAANLVFIGAAAYFSTLGYLIQRFGEPMRPIAIIALCSAALGSLVLIFLPEFLKMKLSLLIMTIGVTLLCEEAFLAMRAFREPRVAAAEAGQPYDTRSKLQVVEDSLRQGEPVVPAVFPSVFTSVGNTARASVLDVDGVETLPLTNASSRKVVWCNEIGVWETFNSDAHGFNNPPGLWNQPETKIVAIGDSCVEGICVAPGDDMASIIRRQVPSTVNLGVGNTGPLAQLAILREYASTLRPKTVLWFFFEGNDLANLRTEARNRILSSYLQDGFGQNLIGRQHEIDEAVVGYIDMVREKLEAADSPWAQRLYTVLSLRYLRALAGMSGEDPIDDVLPIFEQVIRTGKASVEKWGGRLVFVYLPTWRRYYGMGIPEDDDGLRAHVLTLVRSVGLKVIDVHLAFAATPDPRKLFPRPGKHYNKQGYLTAAQAVLDALSTEIPQVETRLRAHGEKVDR